MFIPIVPYLSSQFANFYLQDTEDYIIERVSLAVYRKYGIMGSKYLKIEYPDVIMDINHSTIRYYGKDYAFSFVKGLYMRTDDSNLECLFTCNTEPGEFGILYCEKVNKCILVRCVFSSLFSLACVFATLVFYKEEFKGYYLPNKFEIMRNEKYTLDSALLARLMLTDSVLLSKGNNRY